MSNNTVREIVRERLGRLSDHGLRQPRPHVLLAPRRGRLHAVEAEARDDSSQVRARVFDRPLLGLAPAQKGVLNDVFRIGDGAEHAVRETAEERTMALELVGHGHGDSFRLGSRDGPGPAV